MTGKGRNTKWKKIINKKEGSRKGGEQRKEIRKPTLFIHRG